MGVGERLVREINENVHLHVTYKCTILAYMHSLCIFSLRIRTGSVSSLRPAARIISLSFSVISVRKRNWFCVSFRIWTLIYLYKVFIRGSIARIRTENLLYTRHSVHGLLERSARDSRDTSEGLTFPRQVQELSGDMQTSGYCVLA